MEYYIDPVVFIVGKTGGENRAVRNLLDLFAEGATIHFIARYRKEKTGNMDEVRIGEIKTLYTQFQELEKRKNAVLDTIREQEKLTPGLENRSGNVRISGYWKISICPLNLKSKPGQRKPKRRDWNRWQLF